MQPFKTTDRIDTATTDQLILQADNLHHILRGHVASPLRMKLTRRVELVEMEITKRTGRS